MKSISKIIIISFILIITFVPVYSQSAISIDYVDGLFDGKIRPDIPLSFHIRWTNNNPFSVNGGLPCYRMYLRNNGELPNGQFQPIILDTISLGYPDMFDGGFFINYYSADGIGSDTVGCGGFTLFGPGLPSGFDGIVAHISTSVSSDFAGDTLCLDSSFAPPSNLWLWNPGGVPSWSGPHCYEILPSCCVGITGNHDNSPDDQINISDLNYIITYMFNGGPVPLCLEESDVTGDNDIHISDLVYLIDYMFLGGPVPVDCPL